MGMFNFVLDSIKGELFDFKVKRRVFVASTVGQKWHFWGFLRIFCILIFDQNKRHQGLVSFIKQNGQMLLLS